MIYNKDGHFLPLNRADRNEHIIWWFHAHDPAFAAETQEAHRTGASVVTRRDLVQNAMAFSVWPSLRPLAAAALQQIQSEGAPDDETFWAYVRLEFELTPEITNLVSVVRGNFTKANREIAFNEATRLNQLFAPLPDLNYHRETRRNAALGRDCPTAPR